MAKAASSYAHLIGRPARKDAAATEEEGNPAAGAPDCDDEDEGVAAKGTPPANDKEDGKAPKKSKKPSDDDDQDDEDDGDDEDDDSKKKASARRSTLTPAQARRDERARCKAIFSSPHATGRVAVAARLAFDTDMAAADAISLMADLPPSDAPAGAASSPRKSVHEKMAGVISPSVGTDGGAPASDPVQAKVQRILSNAGRLPDQK